MSSVKSLLLGIVFILLVAVGGLVYRNAVERSNRPIACPLSAKVCPDGTSLAAEGTSCTFPACPPPNVTLNTIGIAFAVPTGFVSVTPSSPAAIAQYNSVNSYTSSTSVDAALAPANITIHRYPIATSSTALATIQATAIDGPSGVPVPATAYSSTSINNRQFTVVSIERFEGVVDTAYYFARGEDVLRFDAIDRAVADWSNPELDVSSLPAHTALRQLLATLQGE